LLFQDSFAFLLFALIGHFPLNFFPPNSFARFVEFAIKIGVDIIWYTSAHILGSMSVPCSEHDFRPMKGKNANLPTGVLVWPPYESEGGGGFF
jgi:hypothetical protein